VVYLFLVAILRSDLVILPSVFLTGELTGELAGDSVPLESHCGFRFWSRLSGVGRVGAVGRGFSYTA